MAVGIIAEYNPFHSGHAYQISEVKKICPQAEIVVAMSGSFTQRGEPAILDKWTRANLAVEGGADLVIELPFCSVVRSAQDFACGGVRLLNALGVVDKLAFGAEISDLEKLKSLAQINFSNKIKSEMSEGISYAAAAEKILQIETLPNTILALEYLRALPENIQPILIQRVGAGYADLTLQEISSASAIRNEVYKKNPAWEKISKSISAKTLQTLQSEKNSGLVREDFLFLPLMQKIFSTSTDYAKNIFGMVEGLENLLWQSSKSAKNFSNLVSKMTSKRYQTSRIKRLLLYFLLNVTEFEVADYVRVLAFNQRGQFLLKKISQLSNLPIVTKVTKHLTEKNFLQKNFYTNYQKNLALDISATNLRGLLFATPKIFSDYTTSPIKQDSCNLQQNATYNFC